MRSCPVSLRRLCLKTVYVFSALGWVTMRDLIPCPLEEVLWVLHTKHKLHLQFSPPWLCRTLREWVEVVV